MSDAVLAKVLKLIALTASDNKEEARTSAYIACKLIREHGLTFSTSSTSSSYTSPPYTPPPAPTPTADIKRVVIRSRFYTKCIDCKCPIEAGEQIAWARGAGALCLACYELDEDDDWDDDWDDDEI